MTETTTPTTWPPMRRDAKSAEFFDAAARGELMIRRCATCAQALPPEAAVCTSCGGSSLEWQAADGTASLVSWTVVHRAPSRAYAELTPYVVGIVELTEGPWIYARVIAGAPAAGLPLHAEFVSSPDGESYPVFSDRAKETS